MNRIKHSGFLVLALVLLVGVINLPLVHATGPDFTKSPAEGAALAAGWAGTPIFASDPMVYTDDEGLHLFFTSIFCKQDDHWYFSWDPANMADCNIMDVTGATGYAFSDDDGLTWTFRTTPVAVTGPQAWDNENVETPFVTRLEDTLYLFYCATGERDGELFNQRFQIGVGTLALEGRSVKQALLSDEALFAKRETPLLPYNVAKTGFDNNTQEPSVVIRDGLLEVYYTGLGLSQPDQSIGLPTQQITSINFLRATFDADLNLVNEPEVLPNDLLINMPEVHYVDGLYHVFYTTPGSGGEFHQGEQVGYANSVDGIHWENDQLLLAMGPEGSIDNWGLMAPTVSFQADQTIMFYSAWEMQDHPAFPVEPGGRFGMPISEDRTVYSNVGRAIAEPFSMAASE